ncbi:hypothetical protein DB346_19915 [Verrucomicrobia bacterium LW23]|nr:hypothetical protein DB346_19915 [Verrucomicrobia bacterium LW23]
MANLPSPAPLTPKQQRDARKAALIAQAEWQRQELNSTLISLEGPSQYLRMGWDGLKFVRDHPVLITTVVAVVTRFSLRTLWRIALLPVKALQMYRNLRLM